jgi:Asp-tRNA(Asn)/Glu-tRNA(Gln) amidotransferase A subunit family amidase
MTVAWSFDKVGCLCRTVEDGALILDAIHGPDGRDLSVVDLPFNWNAYLAVRELRIGFLAAAFTEQRPEIVVEGKLFDETTLDQMRRLGMQLQPIGLPDLPINEAGWIASLASETSAVWSELVRDRRDRSMTEHAREEFGVVFRAGQLVPAVEYIRANRVRTLLMEEMRRMMNDIDVYVAPISDLPAGAIAEANLALTNLTGYPAVVVPNGFTTRGTPLGISFIGKLYREAELLAVAKAYQDSTTFHQQRPNLDASPK